MKYNYNADPDCYQCNFVNVCDNYVDIQSFISIHLKYHCKITNPLHMNDDILKHKHKDRKIIKLNKAKIIKTRTNKKNPCNKKSY